MVNWFKRIVIWFKHDRFKLEHLRQLVIEDNQWIAHDTTARALTDRYLAALSDDWYRKSFERSDQLRSRLNLDPHHPKPSAVDLIQQRHDEIWRAISNNEDLVNNKELSRECCNAANADLRRIADELYSLIVKIKGN